MGANIHSIGGGEPIGPMGDEPSKKGGVDLGNPKPSVNSSPPINREKVQANIEQIKAGAFPRAVKKTLENVEKMGMLTMMPEILTGGQRAQVAVALIRNLFLGGKE